MPQRLPVLSPRPFTAWEIFLFNQWLAEKTLPNWPLTRLLATVYSAKQDARKSLDRAKGETRGNTGVVFQLRELKDLKNDAMVADFLSPCLVLAAQHMTMSVTDWLSIVGEHTVFGFFHSSSRLLASCVSPFPVTILQLFHSTRAELKSRSLRKQVCS